MMLKMAACKTSAFKFSNHPNRFFEIIFIQNHLQILGVLPKFNQLPWHPQKQDDLNIG